MGTFVSPGRAERDSVGAMLDLFADSPLLLLFTVVSVGWALGHVRVAGFSLGVAAVLFAGLAAGALDERLVVPDIIGALGLVLFVYTIGLASGRGFVHAVVHRHGIGANLGALLLIGGVAALAAVMLGAFADQVGAATRAGAFAGALTNTPALAAVVATPLVPEPPRGLGLRSE